MTELSGDFPILPIDPLVMKQSEKLKRRELRIIQIVRAPGELDFDFEQREQRIKRTNSLTMAIYAEADEKGLKGVFESRLRGETIVSIRETDGYIYIELSNGYNVCLSPYGIISIDCAEFDARDDDYYPLRSFLHRIVNAANVGGKGKNMYLDTLQ
jgi:hypothetical protein